ncbi:MAG: hypothetical protein AAGA63_11590 [Pseudomonadota bacterium]
MDNLDSLYRQFSIQEVQNEASLKLGNVYIPHRNLSETVSSFCSPIFEETGNIDYQLVPRGSATFLKHRNRYFAVLTYHQFLNQDYEKAAFFCSENSSIVKGGTFRWLENRNLEDTHSSDLLLIELTEAVQKGLLNSSRFFPLSTANSIKNGDKIYSSLALGFAVDDQKYDNEELEAYDFRLNRIGSVVRVLEVSYSGDSFDDTVCRWNSSDKPVFNANGFSGGGVFSLIETSKGLEIKLAGIVITSNSVGSIFHTIKADTVMRYITSLFDH